MAPPRKVTLLKDNPDHGKPKVRTRLRLRRFDGKLVPRWIVQDALKPARKAGVQFTVISGYRSPAYSTSLCEAMCGAPTCPGRCAGATSNHSCPPTHTGRKFEGAVDVYPGAPALRAWCESHGNPIRGGGAELPSDPNHFSRSGV